MSEHGRFRKCVKCGHEWMLRKVITFGRVLYPEPARCPNPDCRTMLWAKKPSDTTYEAIENRGEGYPDAG